MQSLKQPSNFPVRKAIRIPISTHIKQADTPSYSKIIFNVTTGVEFVNPTDVCYLQAQSNYCKIVLKDRSILVSKTLKQCATLFPSSFLRVHQSYLVNAEMLRSFNRKSGLLTTDFAHNIPVSRSCRSVIRDFIKRQI